MVGNMTRENFKKIIELRSDWEFGKGDYELPSGNKVSEYVLQLVESQMELDKLAISDSGDLHHHLSGGCWNTETKDFDDYEIMIPFKNNEICDYDEQEERVKRLVNQIVNRC